VPEPRPVVSDGAVGWICLTVMAITVIVCGEQLIVHDHAGAGVFLIVAAGALALGL
jgi:hypothetical protein